MSQYKFTVDTHIFRELGELLVGRDSTAIVELIKNAYDADATHVHVVGENLDSATDGRITITDDGIGMTPEVFRDGFLRIASRTKESGDRQSKRFKRRYTGAKGVGRLAAHKLASRLEVISVPDSRVHARNAAGVSASIDWVAIDQAQTLDSVPPGGLNVRASGAASKGSSGTTLVLTGLRREWSEAERSRLFWETQTFRPPSVLLCVPSRHLPSGTLLGSIRYADAGGLDPGFDVVFGGDFEVGDEYWDSLLEVSDVMLEIRSDPARRRVEYQIAPTLAYLQEYSGRAPESANYEIPTAEGDRTPAFVARLLIREGGTKGARHGAKPWIGRMNGVRVYSEGFRVLPYGDPGDDWLHLDRDYKQRKRRLQYLEDYEGLDEDRAHKDEGLIVLGNESYFGAVFLKLADSADLQMVVSREGYLPNQAFESLRTAVRRGIDLSVRWRSLANQRKKARETPNGTAQRGDAHGTPPKEELAKSISGATRYVGAAKAALSAGDIQQAAEALSEAEAMLKPAPALSEKLIRRHELERILAAVGLQMAAFVHEVEGLILIARAVERTLKRLRSDMTLKAGLRQELGQTERSVSDLRHSIERMAVYLTDVSSPDARRRRSRQPLHERFLSARRLFAPTLEAREVTLTEDVPVSYKTRPMFPAETTLLFTNVLSNAIKAAGVGGSICVSAARTDGSLVVRVENTGLAVDLDDSERLFEPFESTSTDSTPELGQGMGMGLPICRNLVEEYGGSIRFVAPTDGFSTAVEFVIPND